jgi:4-amino-4-deoxy-L-arabinose transferase-like glycosyltransferase
MTRSHHENSLAGSEIASGDATTAGTAAPPLSPCPDPAARRRPWWAVWRSPDGQPGWARPALLGIAALAALLYAWNITKAGYAPLYSTGVQYMSHSWKGFLYGALNSHQTLDKLAGSFLPQALSARIFGFHAWSLALPQVIEGVICVLVMYRVVRRWAGVVPGLLAAGIFTLTPIAASMFGHSMEDGALTMCLVLAADFFQRAVLEGRLRPLIWSGVWVGLGFQAKMLEAWMVLPALAAAYLLFAPGPARRRLAQLGAAGVVMLAVSMSWVALYSFTPARDRPYISGSTDNSAIAMVFGYNGLSRFGIQIPWAATGTDLQVGPHGIQIVNPGQPAGTPHGAPAGSGPQPAAGHAPAPTPGVQHALGGNAATNAAGATGRAKLLGGRFGAEIGWLYPLALLALAYGLARWRRAPRTDPVRGGFAAWGIWLLTFGGIFTAMGTVPHTAYIASLAPPLAALGGTGIVLGWRAYRAGSRAAWLLPAAVLAELAWAGWLWSGYASFLPWARWAVAAIGLAATAVLVAGLLTRGGRHAGATRLVTAVLATAVAAALAAPAIWSLSVLDVRYAGTSYDADAGPAGVTSGSQNPACGPGSAGSNFTLCP